MGLTALCFPAEAQKVVILHTNDTHSAVEPTADGRGGLVQLKAVMDSVRKAERNVIAVDAGDMVQGSLYFKYFRGDVEYPLFNMIGYDVRIPGNHEFDNGMKDLAEKYSTVKAATLSANYDFSGTELEGLMQPWAIRKAGGRKIGFIGLGVNPESLILKENFHGVYSDPIEAANRTAAFLKNDKKVDLVVVVSHIGYRMMEGKPSDTELARSSRDIDIIIGGHTHTLIDPATPESTPSLIPNADGRMVRVVQSGKGAQNVGKVTVDFSRYRDGEDTGYEIIPVTDRFPPEKLDAGMIAFLKPFRACVDSVNNRVIAQAGIDMSRGKYKIPMGNMTADLGLEYANHIADSLRNAGHDFPRVDLAIMNNGGIRHPMPLGNITEGQILSTYPFSNHFVIVSIKGKDIIDALAVAARKGGEAISGNVRVVTDADRNLKRVVIDGREMDPEKTYTLGSIDYVAEGNDDLTTLGNHVKLWVDAEEVAVPILEWFKRQTALGLKVIPSTESRFVVGI